MDKFKARSIIEEKYEWRKWMSEIPFLTFKESWEVKVIPPFGGAVVRFVIRHKNDLKTNISIYLDCYEELGLMNGKPYWEMYPFEDDIKRFYIEETDELLEGIDTELKRQISKNIEEKVEDDLPKFYTYSQNNSYGYFESNNNVCSYVIVEAKSAEHANDIAKKIGIYFDGISKGIDCSCCGDRWYEQTDDEKGKEEPMIYGVPVKKKDKGAFRDKCIVHYLNGTKETFDFQ